MSQADDLHARIPPPPSRGESARISTRLGEREREVLDVVWSTGSATVQQVAQQLATSLAYTTVMTTLDRLYKKQLLLRERRDRAFVYRPALSRNELERGRADAVVEGFFSKAAVGHDALLSCLVDAVRSYDSTLLLQLEEKVRLAKLEMMAEDQSRKGRN